MAADVQSERPWQTEIKSLQAGILHIYNTKELADIVLIVSDKKFKAHRLLLGARSPKLAQMLLNTNSGYPKELDLNIEGVSKEGFEKLLHYIYTDELLNEDDILQTYRTARLFEQEGLLNKCEEIIKNTVIGIDNVCTLLKEASDIDILKTLCFDYIKSSDAEAVLCSEGFITLADENMRELLEGECFENVPTMMLLVNVLRWGDNQFPPQDDFKLVRDLLLLTDKPLLGLIGIEKLNLSELIDLVTNFAELLTQEEAMQFFAYALNGGTSGLPIWCGLDVDSSPDATSELGSVILSHILFD